MAQRIVTPRDVEFGGFYYQALQARRAALKRTFLPDHTEQDPYDVLNALGAMDDMALHVLLAMIDDGVANLFVPTLNSRAAAVAVYGSAGRFLRREVPASVDMLATLTQLLTAASTAVLPTRTRFGTQPSSGEDPSVEFEHTGDDLTATPTDFASSTDGTDRGIRMAFAAAGTFTSPALATTQVWPGPTDGDAAYFGHPELMFSELDLVMATAAGANGHARWEYYDDLYSFTPDVTADLGGGVLRHELTSFYGTSDVTDGILVARVTYLPTGAYEDVEVEYSASVHFVETSYLGQAVPSEVEGLYTVQPFWVPVPDLVDGTDGLTTDGNVTWSVPQSATTRWATTEINGITAYWVRARCIAGGAFTEPKISTVSCPRKRWHLLVPKCVQGRTVAEDLGETSGADFQAFALGAPDIIEGSVSIAVDGDDTWTTVRSLYGYDPDDKVVQLEERPDGSFHVIFGDNVTGARPTSSLQVVATYRVGASLSGNVGAATVVQPTASLAYLAETTNPRPATGWQEREGRDDGSLAQTEANLRKLALELPGFVRSVNGCVTAEGVQSKMLAEFLTTDGRQPFARIDAYESPTDPRVTLVYVVGSGGAQVDAADLLEGEEWLNGTAYGWQRTGQRMTSGQTADVLNHVAHAIHVTTTVQVRTGYAEGVVAAVEAELTTALGPLARERMSDSEDVPSGPYVHTLGGKVSPVVWLYAIRRGAGAGFVDQTTAASDSTGALAGAATLAAGELPAAGTLTVTVVEV